MSAYAQSQPKPASTNADDRATEFHPVEGGPEMQSGERLLVEAYAAIWLVLFVLLLTSWRKQKAIDKRVAALEAALARVSPPADVLAADPSGRHAPADVLAADPSGRHAPADVLAADPSGRHAPARGDD